VPVLTSHVDPDGETYRANRAAQLALLDELGKQLEQAIAGGGERYQQRHRDRGRLLARERIELLVDPDSPFLELSALAAWGTGFTVGASIVNGIGVISGVGCVIIAHDPTVRGGAMNPYSRADPAPLEIARLNRLPVVNLVESGGADLPPSSTCSSRPDGSSTSSPSCPGSRFPPWRWSSVTRPPAARTCPACATTRSWWTGRPRCSSAARRW
jgi:acetyl-CoA carboxylase carboxyltransferase component